MNSLGRFAKIIFLVSSLIACQNSQKEIDSLSVSMVNEEDFVKLVIIKPKRSTEISGSYWGIQASTLDLQLLKRAADIGVKWTRLGCNWNEVEKEKGSYDWSETDAASEAILKTGITPFVTIGHGNWLPWNAQEDLSKLALLNLEISRVHFKQPVLVDLLKGNVYDLQYMQNEKDQLVSKTYHSQTTPCNCRKG